MGGFHTQPFAALSTVVPYLRPGARLESAVRVADQLLLGENLEETWHFILKGGGGIELCRRMYQGTLPQSQIGAGTNVHSKFVE